MKKTSFSLELLHPKPEYIIKMEGTVDLIRIDDNWLSNPAKYKKKINSMNKINFTLKEGYYALKININYEIKKLKIFKENVFFTFGKLLKINNKRNLVKINLKNEKSYINDNEIREIFNKIRSDRNKCFFCHKNFSGYGDRYLCSHCKRYYCGDHRIPETHGCKGKIIWEGRYRKIVSRNSTEFEY